jgi:GntR family transcriptional regulator, transcriptional repressor for pyruvate dehydrogenase complex
MTSGAATTSTAQPNGIYRRITTDRASDQVLEQLQTLIRDGRLKAGDRLPASTELANQFGVSRSTVREALRGLEASGMATIKVGARGGAYVTEPTSLSVGRHIFDMLTLSSLADTDVTEARHILELNVIPLVCERATDDDIRDLLDSCDRGAEMMKRGSCPLTIAAEFHCRVVQASHNAAIAMLAGSFYQRELSLAAPVDDQHPECGLAALRAHRRLVTAIAKRDAEKATGIMRSHLRQTAREARGLT